MWCPQWRRRRLAEVGYITARRGACCRRVVGGGVGVGMSIIVVDVFMLVAGVAVHAAAAGLAK